MRLSPQDPQIFNMQSVIACAHFSAGRYAEAVSWAEQALREHSDFFLTIAVLAASCALLGRDADAQRAMAELLRLRPALRCSNMKEVFLIREDNLARWVEGLCKAGLPE